MRLFLAINPPASIRRAIWSATAPMREAAPSVSWAAEPRIHLTLKFFGEQPEDAVPVLVAAIRTVAATHAAPMIRVGGIGAFPNFRRPKVFWIGIEPDPRLELLHHDVEVACSERGYALEGRPFRPHLTLGRVKSTLHAAEKNALRSAAAKVRFTDEFLAGSVDLMHSVIGSSGSTYTTLDTAPMRAT